MTDKITVTPETFAAAAQKDWAGILSLPADDTETAEEAPGGDQQAEGVTDDAGPQEAAQDADGAPEDGKGSSREAQKLRGRLREAESERDTAIDERDTARRLLVEIAAADQIAVPGALWKLDDLDLADLLDDTGRPDRDRVTAAVDRAIEELGAQSIGRRPYNPNMPTRRPVGPYAPGEGATPTLRPADPLVEAFRQ